MGGRSDKASAAADESGDTLFTDLHPDIIKSHLLTRLDGPTLGTAACCSTTLRHLSSDQNLWSHICHSTWPSTSSSSRLSHFVATFPDGGPRSFFSHAYPIPMAMRESKSSSSSKPPAELVSAVDIWYKEELIFSKSQETETVSGWFRCSPLRIDLLEPKDVVPTAIKLHPEVMKDMRVSWIVMDVIGGRAVNLSSEKPVRVQRHWLTGEVQARYASILGGEVQWEIVVTCWGSHVKEVCLQVEDIDGRHMNGKDSLVFLQGALEGKKGNARNRVQEAHRRYKEYVEKKKARRERKMRAEGILDTLCVAFGVSIFVAFCSYYMIHVLIN